MQMQSNKKQKVEEGEEQGNPHRDDQKEIFRIVPATGDPYEIMLSKKASVKNASEEVEKLKGLASSDQMLFAAGQASEEPLNPDAAASEVAPERELVLGL